MHLNNYYNYNNLLCNILYILALSIFITFLFIFFKYIKIKKTETENENFLEYIQITRYVDKIKNDFIDDRQKTHNMDNIDDILPFEYGIQEIFNNKSTAAHLLADLHYKMINYANALHNKYPNDPRTLRLWERITAIKIEEAPQETDTSSFTLNKSELMAICLRPKYGEMNNSYNFHDMDTLWFVVAHEMAHVMSLSEGHNDEFIMNFKYILKTSHELGYYKNPQNYNELPINYCGVKVTNNPFF